MTEFLVVGIVLGLVSILLPALSWLAARGTLPMNPIAGIRIPSTMRSPAAWRAGHRGALPWTVVTAVVVVAGALVMMLARPRSGAPTVVWPLCLAGVLIIGTIVASVVASRAARDVG